MDYKRYIHKYGHAYIGENDECLLLMKETTPKLLIGSRLWDGEAVYVIPEMRKGKTLYSMYQFMFNNFEGEIVGLVAPGSEHTDIVAKRGRYIGSAYTFNRDTFRKDT